MKIEGIFHVFSKSFKYAKFLSVILAGVLLCGTLAGCNGDGGQITTEPPVSDSESDSSDTPSQDGKVVLASNGKTDFTIWVASDIYANYPDVINQINDVTALIKSKTDASVKIMSDSSYSIKATKKPAMLIGNTKFAESKQVSDNMKSKDYYVGMTGDKIVLNGGDIDGISKAIRFFYITVLNSQKVTDKTMVFDPAVHTLHQTEKYDINSIKFGDVELGTVNIVLPRTANVNERYFAYALRYWLYHRYGYRMEIVDDSTAKNDHELLVGCTNRGTAAELKENEYSVSVRNGKLCFEAGGMLSYNEMYSYVTETLFKPGNSADHTLSSSHSYKATATESLDNGSLLIASKTGDIRVMLYNVFNGIVEYDDGTSTGPISYRQSMQLEMIRSYAPDVVGFNEYSKNYNEFDALMTGLGYVKVPNNSSIRNNNPIFYDSNRLELLASGYRVYESVDASKVVDESKAAAWAVFNVKETNKRFIVISTHFMWNSPKITAEEGEEARRLNAAELVDLVSDIRALGYEDVPVIMGGDLNSTSQKDSIKIIRDAGYTCAWDIAAVKNNTNGHHSYSRYTPEFNTYSTIYSPNKKHDTAIDHAFVSKGITVNSFVAITVPYALCTSDHCPTVTDFTVN